MMINSESYEFFLEQTREAEKEFFRHAELCGKEVSKITEAVETGDVSNLKRINIKKFKEARESGEQFLVISKKFITEMEMMKKLSDNIFDSDLDIKEAERFELFENYTASIDKSIFLQKKVMNLITDEMKNLKVFEIERWGRLWPLDQSRDLEWGDENDGDDGVNYE